MQCFNSELEETALLRKLSVLTGHFGKGSVESFPLFCNLDAKNKISESNIYFFIISYQHILKVWKQDFFFISLKLSQRISLEFEPILIMKSGNTCLLLCKNNWLTSEMMEIYWLNFNWSPLRTGDLVQTSLRKFFHFWFMCLVKIIFQLYKP